MVEVSKLLFPLLHFSFHVLDKVGVHSVQSRSNQWPDAVALPATFYMVKNLLQYNLLQLTERSRLSAS